MPNYNRTQRIAWSMLIATGAVKSNQLEAFGISERSADYWVECLLSTHITFEDAFDVINQKNDEVEVKYILKLCLDERCFVKKKPIEDKTETTIPD